MFSTTSAPTPSSSSRSKFSPIIPIPRRIFKLGTTVTALFAAAETPEPFTLDAIPEAGLDSGIDTLEDVLSEIELDSEGGVSSDSDSDPGSLRDGASVKGVSSDYHLRSLLNSGGPIVELNPAKIENARSPSTRGIRSMCPAGDRKAVCGTSNRNEERLLEDLKRINKGSSHKRGGRLSNLVSVRPGSPEENYDYRPYFNWFEESRSITEAPSESKNDLHSELRTRLGLDLLESDPASSRISSLSPKKEKPNRPFRLLQSNVITKDQAPVLTGQALINAMKPPFPEMEEMYARYTTSYSPSSERRLYIAPEGQNETKTSTTGTGTGTNRTISLPLQPIESQLKLTDLRIPVDFADLAQPCKNVITNHVMYTDAIPAGFCKDFVMLNPFHMEMPINCRKYQCSMWVMMLGDLVGSNPADSEPAPCRPYVCYLAQFMNSNGGLRGYEDPVSYQDQHCGPRFLRDALTICDWGYRGCASWGGMNKRIADEATAGRYDSLAYPIVSNPGSTTPTSTSPVASLLNPLNHPIPYPMGTPLFRSQLPLYADLILRGNLDNLDLDLRGEWQLLGWTTQTWASRRFGLRQSGLTGGPQNPSDNLVYASNATESQIKNQYAFLPSSELKCYDQLTEVERDAVRKLQITIDGWHLCGDIPGLRDHCDWPHFLSTDGVYPSSHRLYDCMSTRKRVEEPLHQVYGKSRWDHTDGDMGFMTQQKKEAYGDLGYLTAKAWDERQIPVTFIRPYSSLSFKEQAAATFLGYTEEVWDGCPATPCILRKLYAEEISRPVVIGTSEVDSRVWGNLALYMTDNFERIGWTPESWDDGGPTPATIMRSWDELTPGIQEIALRYGFYRDTWNGCPDTPCLDKYRYIERKYNHPWATLSPRIQRTLTKLGWVPPLWDQKVQAFLSNSPLTVEVPDVYRQQWSTLTKDQQIHAEFLDYDEFTWNGCAGANEPQTTAPPKSDGVDPNRRIRARLYMPRSYNEIMSVEPSQATTVAPSSSSSSNSNSQSASSSSSSGTSSSSTTTDSGGFTLVAKQAISRALFCNNPDYDAATNPEQRAPDGLPLCIDRDSYDAQLSRISILLVAPGIRLDFEIGANRTDSESPGGELRAIDLYARLAEKVTNPQSDFRYDADFSRFTQVAQLTELSFDEADFELEQANRAFENLRMQYNKTNSCELLSDKKNGVDRCPTNSGRRRLGGITENLVSILGVLVGAVVGGWVIS